MCFALHFCISSPEPRAALVLTRSSGDPVLLLERGARAAGTRRLGGPRAAAAGAESYHLFSPKRLRVWVGGAGEGAWGGVEEEQHLLLLLHSSETPLQRRPQPTAWPRSARSASSPSCAQRATKGFAKPLLRRAAQLLLLASSAAEVAEADRGARVCCLPARRSLRAAIIVCYPRRGRGNYLHNYSSSLGGRAGPASVPVTRPLPGSWSIADLQPSTPLVLIGPPASSPSPSPGTRSPGRLALWFPWLPVQWAWLLAFFWQARRSGWWPRGKFLSPAVWTSNFRPSWKRSRPPPHFQS